jgi:hypothetical protein
VKSPSHVRTWIRPFLALPGEVGGRGRVARGVAPGQVRTSSRSSSRRASARRGSGRSAPGDYLNAIAERRRPILAKRKG